MMPSAASLARYPAFLKHETNSNQFTSSIPDQSTSLSSNSSISSSSSITPPTFDFNNQTNLINDSFLQSEFQRNIAQFTNQLTMTGQNDLLSTNGSQTTNNSDDNSLQYSEDQLINSSNKKLNFSIDSLVNGKNSNLVLNKQAAVAAALTAFNGLNGTGLNINNLLNNKKESQEITSQNLNAIVNAAINRNSSLQKKLNLNNKSNELNRNSTSPNSRLISPCSSTSSSISNNGEHNKINNSNGSQQQQQQQRTSANNSPRPSSAASQHSQHSNSASQLLNAANLQNNNNNLSNNSSSSLINSKLNNNKQIKEEERNRSPVTTPSLSASPSNFLKNEANLNASTTDTALLQHLQQQQLRQQLQQLHQAQNCPDAALLQHLQQQQQLQLRQQLQSSSNNSSINNQNIPLPTSSPSSHLTNPQQQNPISQQTNQQQTPQQNGPQNSFNPNNSAAALLSQIRGSNPALNPLNGLNLSNLNNLTNATAGLPGVANPPNLPNPLGTLGQLNQAAAAAAAACAASSPLNSLMPSLNTLSPPRPLDYQSYYHQYLAMARQNYYLPGNSYMSPFPFIMGMTRKPKRIRTAFNPNQLLQLEQAFEKNQYVVGQERKALANSLQLSETQVKVWFQNRRTKHKRLKTDGDDPSKSPLSDNNDKCYSGDEDIDEDDTEIDPDGFNNDELKMQQLINSNFNPFATGFSNLGNLSNLNQSRQAEFFYSQFAAAAAQAANQSNTNRTNSNSVSNSQSTNLTAQQS